MKPDLSKITYQQSSEAKNDALNLENWLTAEQIEVKPSYTAKDIENLRHRRSACGVF